MDKVPNFDNENDVLNNTEKFVLDRLLAKHDSEEGPSINIGELMTLVDNTMSPLLDQAIEGLVAQRLIHSLEGENYQITQDGIDELENRKREVIPL